MRPRKFAIVVTRAAVVAAALLCAIERASAQATAATSAPAAVTTTMPPEVDAEIARAEVRILVASLSASDAEECKRAEAKLITLGETAERAIDEMAWAIDNREAQSRVATIRRGIEIERQVREALQ